MSCREGSLCSGSEASAIPGGGRGDKRVLTVIPCAADVACCSMCCCFTVGLFFDAFAAYDVCGCCIDFWPPGSQAYFSSMDAAELQRSYAVRCWSRDPPCWICGSACRLSSCLLVIPALGRFRLGVAVGVAPHWERSVHSFSSRIYTHNRMNCIRIPEPIWGTSAHMSVQATPSTNPF